jgi:predicted MFS family arabinose efflux permease
MKKVFNAAIGLLIVVQAGLYLTGSAGLWPLAILLTLFFVAFNVLEATQPSWISRIAPPHAKGTALGIYNTLQSVGLFLGGALGGWLVQHVGRARYRWGRSCPGLADPCLGHGPRRSGARCRLIPPQEFFRRDIWLRSTR